MTGRGSGAGIGAYAARNGQPDKGEARWAPHSATGGGSFKTKITSTGGYDSFNVPFFNVTEYGDGELGDVINANEERWHRATSCPNTGKSIRMAMTPRSKEGQVHYYQVDQRPGGQ